MYRLERESFLTYPLIALWGFLGLQAGFINSYGFLACGRFVSHVTGFGTQIGVLLGAHKYSLALELLGFPLSFIIGSMLSGALTIARLDQNLRPRYDLVTLLLPLALFILAVAGNSGVFGSFGSPHTQNFQLLLLFFLSFLCGMQNGCFATITKGQIRTTHLTGISTDIGTDLSRLYFGKIQGFERELVIRANISRIFTFSAFAIGSIIAVPVTEQWGYIALSIPIITSAIVAFVVINIGHAMDQKILPVLNPELKPALSLRK